MSEGKRNSQACHASSNSLIQFLVQNPERLNEFYLLQNSGSRVTLKSKTLKDIEIAYKKAMELNIPCYLMYDSGHIHGSDFDGETKIITALGIGPCSKEQARAVVKKFQVL